MRCVYVHSFDKFAIVKTTNSLKLLIILPSFCTVVWPCVCSTA